MGNIYKESIGNLMNRIPVLRKEQLILYLVKMHGLTIDIANLLIERTTESGHILISPNNFVTTRATVDLVYKKEDISIREHVFKLARPIFLSGEIESQIDAFWLVLKNLPNADDFVFLNGPITAVYTDKDRNRIVEIVVIPLGKEILYTNLFKYHFSYSSEAQKYYERIGIVDSPNRASLIGNVGFTGLYYIDKAKPDGHILYSIETREHTVAWKDVVCIKENIEEEILYEL